jgi:hypothetical protein
MATTTNYGWTTPDDTSLVKDGASAIRTLGSSIDTSLNNALGTKKAGLVLLNTTSFSAVSAASLPASTFTSAYRNYLLVVNITANTVTGDLRLRLRASGTDNTSSVYGNAIFFENTGAGFAVALQNTGDTNWAIGYVDSTQNATRVMLNIFDPFTSIQTSGVLQMTRSLSTTTGGMEYRSGGFSHGNTASFDAATIYPASGTITGSYSIFGYNV